MVDEGARLCQSTDPNTAFVQIGDRTFGKKSNFLLCMILRKNGKNLPACRLFLLHG